MSRNKGISASSAICDYDRQERIIEEKRNIFLAKKAGLIPPIQLKSKPTTTSPSNQSNVHPQPLHQPDRSNLPFANDGSFFEQFMKIQTPLPDTTPSLPHSRLHPVSLRSIRSPPPLTPTTSPSQIWEQKPPLPSTPVPAPCSKKRLQLPPPIPSIVIKTEFPPLPPFDPIPPHDLNLNPSERPPPLPCTSFKPPPPPPVSLKLQPLRQTDQLVTAPILIFRSEEAPEEPHDSDEGDMVSEFEIAEKMARQLALDGEQAIKEFKRVNKKDGPYSFLCDSSNPVALYFSQKLSEYQHANDPIASAPHPPPPPVLPPVPPTPPEYAPRRKTRWSDEGEAVKIPPSVVSAINDAGSQHKQAEVQRALNRLANSIRGARGQGRGRGMKRFCGIKYEYDSDEENEYGTWEHKRRAVEMQKTSDTANQLTEQAQGKHHLSDYLPGEEYLRFMAQVEKARGGDVVKMEYSDYKDNEIKQDNIGYQMLQRAGWHEGQGLGAQQQGIITPVNKGRSSLDSTGVGSGKAADVKSEDDEFSLYRKRMMLAYKFRPNPLNNPRRPYYD